MSKREKIIERIRNMNAFADDPAATPNEAAAFARKAAKLVNEYTITQQELEPEDRSEFQVKRYHLPDLNNWRMMLVTNVGYLFSTRVAITIELRRIEIVGRLLNIESTYETYIRLEEQIVNACEDLFPNDIPAQLDARKGMTIGVASKLNEIRRSDIESTLPVVQEIKEVTEFMENTLKTEEGTSPVKIDSISAYVGYIQSDKVEINKEVES